MAHIFLSELKTALNECIDELDEIHFMFCKNPESDFTRNRKLSLSIISFILCPHFSGSSLSRRFPVFPSTTLSIGPPDLWAITQAPQYIASTGTIPK